MAQPGEPNIKPGYVGQSFLWDLSDLFDHGFVDFSGETEETGAIIVRYVVENWTIAAPIINALNTSYRVEAERDVNQEMKSPVRQMLRNDGKGYVRLTVEGKLDSNDRLTKFTSIEAKYISR